MLGVLAALADLGPLRRVVQVSQAGVVELQVAAAQVTQPLDLVGVGQRQVTPELLEVRVDVGIEHGRPAPVVHHVRRRNGLLGHRRGHVRLQEREILTENSVVKFNLAADVQRRRSVFNCSRRVGELHREVSWRLLHAAKGVDEVHVPRRPAELTVGGRLQAHLLLHPDRLDDLLILHRPEFGGGDRADREILARLEQPLRPQQAAHVVGPERRGGSAGHR
jgi:hypothetical protein